MIQRRNYSLLSIIIVSFFLCLIIPGQAISFSGSKIFILHSYEKGHVCGDPQHDGIIGKINESGFIEGKNLETAVYYMDTKRKNNTPSLIEKQAQIALKRIASFKPDVLITLDDNAFKYVALKLAGSKTPIVYCGMNGQPETYNKQEHFLNSKKKPGHNITGIYEKLHIADAIRVHAKMFPDFKKIIIFSDLSPTGKAINKQIMLELGAESIPVKWELIVVKSWDEYKDGIFFANDDPETGAIYPAALLLKDEEGKTYTAPQIFKWTSQYSKKPEIALNYAFTKQGLFGGAAVDFHAMGQQAGEMVVRILNGEKPGDISLQEATRYALAFNLKRAKDLGIKIPSDILLAADEIIKE